VVSHTDKSELNVCGPQVSRLRVNLGWSQPQLAAKCQIAGWDVSRDIIARIELKKRWVRARLAAMPFAHPLPAQNLRACQVEGITHLESSFAADRPRALIQMATGAGKTYTACSFTYRLIKYAGARRVLFLVDRANLGRQAMAEFQQFVAPDSVVNEMWNNGDILIPDYQRNFVWSINQSSLLIESFLLGLPVPQVFSMSMRSTRAK